MKKRKKPESGALTEKQQYIKHRQIIFTVVCLFSLKKIVYNDKKIRGGKFVKIITLMENTQGEEGCAFEHGLSLYIETEKHKILADTGATGAFAENAEKLGVNLSSVDMVVLSHGHYDHSGGILTFTEKNRHARIYMQQKATGDFYHGQTDPRFASGGNDPGRQGSGRGSFAFFQHYRETVFSPKQSGAYPENQWKRAAGYL